MHGRSSSFARKDKVTVGRRRASGLHARRAEMGGASDPFVGLL
jgi:hypothetical protein